MTVRHPDSSYLDFACTAGATAFAGFTAVDHDVDEFMQLCFFFFFSASMYIQLTKFDCLI